MDGVTLVRSWESYMDEQEIINRGKYGDAPDYEYLGCECKPLKVLSEKKHSFWENPRKDKFIQGSNCRCRLDDGNIFIVKALGVSKKKRAP